MVVNRIGDVGLALAMFVIYDIFKSLNFSVIFSTIDLLKDSNITIFTFSFNAIVTIGILLLIGATGKSAQLGLHT
jgi:NADH-quinone oxidoreductase subunit L